MINLSNGKVLYEHNPNLSIRPASLTKVMTMYVVMDRIKMGRLKRNTSIRVHPTARVGGFQHAFASPARESPWTSSLPVWP